MQQSSNFASACLGILKVVAGCVQICLPAPKGLTSSPVQVETQLPPATNFGHSSQAARNH